MKEKRKYHPLYLTRISLSWPNLSLSATSFFPITSHSPVSPSMSLSWLACYSHAQLSVPPFFHTSLPFRLNFPHQYLSRSTALFSTFMHLSISERSLYHLIFSRPLAMYSLNCIFFCSKVNDCAVGPHLLATFQYFSTVLLVLLDKGMALPGIYCAAGCRNRWGSSSMVGGNASPTLQGLVLHHFLNPLEDSATSLFMTDIQIYRKTLQTQARLH